MAMGQAAAGAPPDPPKPPGRAFGNVPEGTGTMKWYDSTDEDEDEDEEPPKRRRLAEQPYSFNVRSREGTRRAFEKNEDSDHWHARPTYSTPARGLDASEFVGGLEQTPSEQGMPQYRPRIVRGPAGSMHSPRASAKQNSRVSSTVSPPQERRSNANDLGRRLRRLSRERLTRLEQQDFQLPELPPLPTPSDRAEFDRLASENPAQKAPRYYRGIPLGRRGTSPLVNLGVRDALLCLPDPEDVPRTESVTHGLSRAQTRELRRAQVQAKMHRHRTAPLYSDPDLPHTDSTMQLHEEAASTVVGILSSLTPLEGEPEQQTSLERPSISSVVPSRGRTFANGQGQSTESGEGPSIWTIGRPHHTSGDDAPSQPDASSETEDIARQSRGPIIDVSHSSSTPIRGSMRLILGFTNYVQSSDGVHLLIDVSSRGEGEVTKMGGGESYRPSTRPRSPPRIDSFRGDRDRDRDRSPRRERARTPQTDSWHPSSRDRSPRRRSRTPTRRDRSPVRDNWRARPRSPMRARTPPRRFSPRRDDDRRQRSPARRDER
jgi:hypothetical protein